MIIIDVTIDKTIRIASNNIYNVNNVKSIQNIGTTPIYFSIHILNNNNNGFKLMPNDFVIFSSNISLYIKSFHDNLDSFITVSSGGY